MAGSLASINIRFFADLKQFSTAMQTSSRKIARMGKQLSSVGKNISIGLTAPLVALGGLSVKTFADFEQGMAKVKAISGATGLEFKSLEESALLLGRTTRFTATQVSALQLAYSKLGFNPAEIIKVTAATLDLALATGEDLATSATVAASTLRGFELSATEMGRVVDVMAASFSSSALDLEKFSTAMATLAPVAKNAGVGLEEATSYLSILVDRGVDASTAGTGLRNMFLNLAESGQTLSGALEEINNSTNKNATALRLFGKRGATVAAIMAANVGEAQSLKTAYDGAGGSASRMAAIMDDTLQGSLFKLKSAFEGMQLAIGEELKGAVTKLASVLSTLANKFTNLSPEIKKTILFIAGVTAVVGPLLVVFGALMTALAFLSGTVIPAVIAVFIQLTTVMLANPVVAIAAGVTALTVAFLSMVQTITPLVSKLKTFFNLIKSGGNFQLFLNAQVLDQVANQEELAKSTDKVAERTERMTKMFAGWNKELADSVVKVKKVAKVVSRIPVAAPTISGGETPTSSFEKGDAFNPVSAEIAEIKDLLGTWNDFEVQSPLTGLPELMTTQVTGVSDQFLQLQDNAIAFNDGFTQIIEQGVAGFLSGFGELLGGFANGTASFKDIGGLLLGTIGGMLVSLGRMAIGIGVGIKAIKVALKTLNPFLAIGAGIAAIALGTIFKNGASKISSGKDAGAFADGGVVGGSSYYGDKLFARVNSGEAIFNQDQQKSLYNLTGSAGAQHITVSGVLRGRGAELIGVIDKTNVKLARNS